MVIITGSQISRKYGNIITKTYQLIKLIARFGMAIELETDGGGTLGGLLDELEDSKSLSRA